MSDVEDPFLTSLRASRISSRWLMVWEELARRLKSQGADEARLLFLRIARVGRKWRKELIKKSLELLETAPDPEFGGFLRSLVDEVMTVDLILHDRETGITVPDIRSVLGRLEGFPKTPPPILRVIFQTPHAYVYGLCAIAAWSTKHARKVDLESDEPRTEYFVARAGILEALRDRDSEPVRFDTDTILGFTRIDPGTDFNTDAHAGRLVDLFRRHSELSPATSQALSICFSELIENAKKHGEIQSPAWLFANYHPQPKIMHICICDRGIGIRETFKQSSNERLRELSLDQTAWVRTATEALVTSKSEGHAGYGLHLARELCRRNGGRMLVVSGSAAFELRPQRSDSMTSDIDEVHDIGVNWLGTLVAMQLRLDHELDLGPIYAALPKPSYESDDIGEVSLFDE